MNQPSESVFLVTGYDVGGNSGFVVEAVFANKADAEFYAQHAKATKHNNAFGPRQGAPFDVEEHRLVLSLADVADELSQPPAGVQE